MKEASLNQAKYRLLYSMDLSYKRIKLTYGYTPNNLFYSITLNRKSHGSKDRNKKTAPRSHN